jgi:hypothetical protein
MAWQAVETGTSSSKDQIPAIALMAQQYAKLAGRGIECEILMAGQRHAAEDDRQKKTSPWVWSGTIMIWTW